MFNLAAILSEFLNVNVTVKLNYDLTLHLSNKYNSIHVQITHDFFHIKCKFRTCLPPHFDRNLVEKFDKQYKQLQKHLCFFP